MAPRFSTMIVDDEPDIRLLLRIRLEQGDAPLSVVAEAGSGLEAIECLDACDPDVAIIDLRMPGIDGIETATLIRERHPDLPVILFSAQLNPDAYLRAEAAGIAACIEKPDIDGLAHVAHRLATGREDEVIELPE